MGGVNTVVTGAVPAIAVVVGENEASMASSTAALPTFFCNEISMIIPPWYEIKTAPPAMDGSGG
jgi:hypothetical protein